MYHNKKLIKSELAGRDRIFSSQWACNGFGRLLRRDGLKVAMLCMLLGGLSIQQDEFAFLIRSEPSGCDRLKKDFDPDNHTVKR